MGNKTRSESFVEDPGDTDVASSVSTFAYDRANRLVKQIDDVGTGGNFVNATTLFVYNAVGSVSKRTDPTGRVSTQDYDRLNRLIKTMLPDPDGGGSLVAPTVTIVHDVLGNVARTTNGEGETTQSVYDARGRQISKLDGLGNETRYAYDSEGNLQRITDASGNITQYTYDALNRVLTIKNQLDDTRTKTYDDSGNVASIEDRNERVTKFTYDDLDRLTKEEWFADELDSSADETLTWQYDAIGRTKLAKHVQGASTILNVDTYDYDVFDRVTERRNYDPNGDDTPSTPDSKLTYTYDLVTSGNGLWSSNTVTQRIGSTDVATTTYATDRLGRLATISDNVLQEVSANKSDKLVTLTYDAAGRLTALDRRSVHNGSAYTFLLDTDYAYDGTGRLQSIDDWSGSTPTQIVGFDYFYDDASRIEDIDSQFRYTNINFNRHEDFTYDDASRLTILDGSYTNLSGTTLGFAIDNDFTLDGTGNRISTAVNGGSSVAADIDPNNQLADDGTYSYLYDDEGNLTRKTKTSDNTYTDYTWDHHNRLVQVNTYDTDSDLVRTITYTYDTNDRLIRRHDEFESGGATEEVFVYDGDQVTMSVRKNGAGDLVNRRYLYSGADELLVDEVFNQAGTVGQAERGYWALADHSGTVHDLVESDADGTATTNHALKQHLDYDSSGKIVRAINASGGALRLDELFSRYAYAGREWDGAAELYYNRARWYDANSGRFISEDPIAFEGGDTNLYRYGAGDPINNLDPSGQSWFSSLFKKFTRAFKSSLNFAKEVITNPDDFIDNLDETAEAMVKDPMFWAEMAVGPLLATNFNWGFFGMSVDLGGIHAGPNWFKAGADALGVLSGKGFSMGVPTLSFESPIFDRSIPLLSSPTTTSGYTPNEFSPMANASPINGRNSMVVQAQFIDEETITTPYGQLLNKLEDPSQVWTAEDTRLLKEFEAAGMPQTITIRKPPLLLNSKSCLGEWPERHDYGGGGVDPKTAKAVAVGAASMVPGVGEVMDLATIVSPSSTWGDRALAGLSLGVNALTAGLAPNFGATARVLRQVDNVDEVVDAGKAVVKSTPSKVMFQSGGLRGVEGASDKLIDTVRSKGRTIVYAKPGSDELRYLDAMRGNANVGGENLTHILFREDPRKIEVLEEFLHGTQQRLGIVDELGIGGAEVHVKDFMIRHQRLMGISPEDATILQQMKGGH